MRGLISGLFAYEVHSNICPYPGKGAWVHVISSLGQHFFIFCFTDFFRNKLGSEDEIKINCVSYNSNSIGKKVRMNFILPIKMGAVTGGNLINLAAVEKTKRKNIIELQY